LALFVGVCVLCFAGSAHAHPLALAQDLPALAQYLGLGFTHILSGVDHLLFLLGLIAIGDRVRDLLLAVTAFTLAHSITLALSVLGVLSPNPLWIEVMIALSIAYVGAGNLLSKAPAGRWRITFAFGLIHGFGFAGALREIGIPRDRAAAALLLFNLGVELGQLLVLALVVPIVLRLRRSARMRAFGVPMLSAALLAIGVIWAGARATAATPAEARASAQPAVRAISPSSVAGPRSIYPRDPGVFDPRVHGLCAAFQDLPRLRRAQCAGQQPGVSLAAECERMLTTSVRTRAIALDAPQAERCMDASRARYEDCAFTNAAALPPLPACTSLWQGTLAQGVVCRSSLECSAGLHCRGLSPLDTGVCAPPEPQGARCGLGMDPLAAYVPHDEGAHAECAGVCERGRCAAVRPPLPGASAP
jgi:hypothetical protein